MAKGSTNRSYLVRTTKNSYVLRIPGIGSSEMVDRHLEKEIYDLMKDYDISDRVVYLNPENGIRISIYCENARFLDLTKENDVKLFLKTVKKLHSLNLQCSSNYDFYEYIEKYERLRNSPSCFEDYEAVKCDIAHLKEFTDTHSGEYTLIHNDLSCENCLLYAGENGEEKCILIDFEYAAMQCPAADIAYFCVFSDLNEAETDKIIREYYEDGCTLDKYTQVYAYIAINAFLHSNWLELKISLEDDKKESRRKESVKAYNMAKLYCKKCEEALKCQESKEQS
jgi:thiamine kinase-like enzyme